jgi:DNA repair ATPase/ATPase family protein associated with various cellular activities (AAA)
MTTTDATTTAPPEGGGYEVIRARLLAQAAELEQKAEALNARRKEIFGGSELALVANERVRTENNCRARDLVAVGEHLLFGFQVFLGLKAETNVADVFGLYRLERTADGFALEHAPPEGPGAFLADPAFVKEFRDLFRYYREAALLQLRRTSTRLLAAVKVGESARDVKVFRFGVDAAGRVAYLDARGEEDNAPPRAHDFAWVQTTREHHVAGPHPHVNVLDEVFVETVGGDLTVKVENNTRDGQGVYREPVDDPNQSLDDADVAYAKVGGLILLRVKPFREAKYRYLVYNSRTRGVLRADAVGTACLTLPEDHGIVFPGGYCLQTGEHKVFDAEAGDMTFDRVVRSPNGEDVLYVFYRHEEGEYALLPYNLVRREAQSPLLCNGYSLFADGSMVVFRDSSPEPTRVHPVQVWRTPFTSAEHAAAPAGGSYLGKVGNAELVRGVSDALSLARLARSNAPTRRTFEDAAGAARRMVDAYHWLGHAEALGLREATAALQKTAELVIDEFEKEVAIRRRAADVLAEAEAGQREKLKQTLPDDVKGVEAFVEALAGLRAWRGHLVSLREVRGVDLARLDALEAEIGARGQELARACVSFLLKAEAWTPLLDRTEALATKSEAAAKASELGPLDEDLARLQAGVGMLADVIAELPVDDPTVRTGILDRVAEVVGRQNRARAVLAARRRELGASEGRAEFVAQIKLFGQDVAGALALAESPEACDEHLARLLVRLEALEGRFGEFDEFLGDLADKRNEAVEAFGARRQTLVEARQRRAEHIAAAAERLVAGVARRARAFATADELNAFFAGDAMVQKLGDLRAQLAALGDVVRAEEFASKLKASKQEALRALRDKVELFEGGEGTVKLGAHRFHVSNRPLELTLVAREGELCLHLTGTDFYEPASDPALEAARDLWDQPLPSESNDVYRGEFLAASMLFDAEAGAAGLSLEALRHAARDGALLEPVRAYAAARLDEGYERGVHDVDAAAILERLLALYEGAGRLRHLAAARSLACLYWSELDPPRRELWQRRGRAAGRLRTALGSAHAQAALAADLTTPLAEFARARSLPEASAPGAARYLVEELAAERPRFVASDRALKLRDALLARLQERGGRREFDEDLRALEPHPAERLALARSYVEAAGEAAAPGEALEAASLLVTDRKIEREPSSAETRAEAAGLLGQHPRVAGRALSIDVAELLARLGAFKAERLPRYHAYRKTRAEAVARARGRLRPEEFAPKVLSSFVRNRLVNEVYLPLVGQNLAKQIGAAGDQKRTDLMGLLLLVSPPGYGKTTLMEYVASRLGLAFVKINGPSIGHEVTSFDPEGAPSKTARQEVEKINLAFEMGQNVMLYLDDIQHTNPELLQKFVSLCDAQRRVEGVWRGRSRTYDLKGKRFCVVMAGNPYTESGARFRIPDMLSNRADVYNLGDVLQGKEDLFALSYLENALTSNPLLAPLAGRDPADVDRFVRLARGERVPPGDFAHGYSAAEADEIGRLFGHLLRVQATLSRVNRAYIDSASQDDAFRSEPAFKLQGSYRNMTKIAEKVVAAMNDDELEALVDDHYQGEAQTLTTGAEHNLLKLAELRGRLAGAEAERWRQIKEEFVRVRRVGGRDDDPAARVAGALVGLDDRLSGIARGIAESAAASAQRPGPEAWLAPKLDELARALATPRPALETRSRPPTPTPPPAATPALTELVAQQTALIERTLVPLVRAAMRPSNGNGSSNGNGNGSNNGNGNGGGNGGGNGEGGSELADLGARLAELTASVARIESRLQKGLAAAERFEVRFGQGEGSNFYRGVLDDDVLRGGGVFVATYGKLPALGSTVRLRLHFPSGASFEADATVTFTQDLVTGDAGALQPGFGARLLELPSEARALVTHYTRRVEPLLRDAT